MQDRQKPHEQRGVRIERPATIGEVAFEAEVPDRLDDRLVLMGALLLASGWDPDVELSPISNEPPPVPADAPPVDEHGCGTPPEAHTTDEPFVEPVVTVKGIQQRLAWLGLYEGPASGVLDDATQRAIRALQESSGLPLHGLPDGPTRDALVARFGW